MSADKQNDPEPFATINETADHLNLPRWKLRDAVNKGLIPSYQLLNRRRLLRISEVAAAIASTRQGGA
jgi:hypothetical protein